MSTEMPPDEPRHSFRHPQGLAFDNSTFDVDHIVAAKEAHETGGHSWDVSTRQRFGNEELNLVA